MRNTPARPISVKAAIFIFGILAFKSWYDVNNRNSESLEVFLPLVLAVPINIAFIGLISDSRVGRVLVVVISALFAVLGALSWLMLLFSTEIISPQFVVITILLFLFLTWFAAYSFGKASRTYYSKIIKNKTEK